MENLKRWTTLQIACRGCASLNHSFNNLGKGHEIGGGGGTKSFDVVSAMLFQKWGGGPDVVCRFF